MIKAKNTLVGRISSKNNLSGKLSNAIVNVYPQLENLTVTPKREEQIFKHPNSYGYDEVIVKAIESETLNITPTEETQSYSGMYDEVNVDKINVEEKVEDLDFSNTDVIEIKNENGYLKKVTINKDENLTPVNIADGVNINGVEGTAPLANFEINDASYLFYGGIRGEIASNLIPLCKKVKSTAYMFYQVRGEWDTTILRDLDTSNSTDFNYMLYFNNSLTELDLSNFDTSSAEILSFMLSYCMNLVKLNVSSFNTSKVKNFSHMFNYSNKLPTLDISNFDFSNATNVVNLLGSMTELTNLTFGTNLGKGYTQKSNNYSNYRLDLSGSKLLTHESLMSVINNLYDLNLTYDVANGGTLYTQQLILGATNIAKLTSEEINTVVQKGWVVS